MEMTGLPTANPLQQGQPVYVALVPGVSAQEGGRFVVRSGWTTSDAEEIHELSRHVLQLATVNCVVAVTFRVIALIIVIIQNKVTWIIEYCFWIVFTFIVLHLGVQGVKLRNPPLVACCACGHLTAFYSIYIIFSVLAGISVLLCLVTGLWGYFVVNVLFLTLYSVTADKARRLLDALERSGTDSSANAMAAGRAAGATPYPGATGHEPMVPIPVAQAQEVGPAPPVAVAAVAADLEDPSSSKAVASDTI